MALSAMKRLLLTLGDAERTDHKRLPAVPVDEL